MEIIMYLAELDITHETPSDMVYQFAKDHGCVAKLILEYGPAGGNPLYQFSSDNYDYLEELVGQVLGFMDPVYIKDFIKEI